MADNSLGKARNLGFLSGTSRVRGAVGKKDRVDFYQFSLSGQQALSLKLRSSRFADAKVSLLDSNGKAIGNASRLNNRTKQIKKTLETGTYFIRIRSAGSNSRVRYSLVGSAPPITGAPSSPGAPSGSAASPVSDSSIVDVGALTGTRFFQTQSVGSQNNPKDFYRFTLSQIGSFNATVSNVKSTFAPASMKLSFDSNGNGVADSGEAFLSDNVGGSPAPVSATVLPAGNYILEVSNGGFTGSSVGYDLTLSTNQNPGNVSPDPGSEAPTAFLLGNLPNTLVAKDYVGFLDKLDVYRFTASTSVTANINVGNLSGNNGNVTVTLFKDINANSLIDSGESVASRNFSSSSLNQSISSLLDTGTYFLSVDNSSGADTAYTLTVQA
jgi:Bacterial pre-peptidase C-terminal domain